MFWTKQALVYLELKHIYCYYSNSKQWTIPQLDKLVNSKTILAQLERAF